MSDRQFREVFIYKGDDLAKLAELSQAARVAEQRYEQAQKRYAATQQSGTARVGDAESPQGLLDDWDAAKAAYDAQVEEAAPRAQTVRIEALGNRQWRALIDEHPPRRVTRLIGGENTEVVHEDDEELGVNTRTLPEVLLTYVDPKRPDMKTIVKPEFPTAESRTEWLDDLAGGDYDKLFLTAFHMNDGWVIDPKGTTFSSGSQPSSETLE